MSVHAKMTAIADAIRGKTGSTAGMTLDEMVDAIAGIEAGDDAGAGLPDGMNVFTFTMTETYPTTQEGWILTIPHGLGAVPSFAIALRIASLTNASQLRGWFGNSGENFRATNYGGFSRDAVSMQDTAAEWLYVDETNLYCKSGSWGGNLNAGITLFVGVLE